MTTNKKVLRFDPSRRRFKLAIRVALFSFLIQIFYPVVPYAQSSGSGQASSTGGVPLSQMVDPFTGDFHYSIPLMDVDGFPLTLTYDGNVTMNQEAGWVGLGWSLNPGAINREMRGIPDDFDGDIVERMTSTLNNTTVGANIGIRFSAGLSVYSGQSIGGMSSLKGGMFTNTYTGKGFNLEYESGGEFDLATLGNGNQYGSGMGISINSATGIGVNTYQSFGYSYGLSFLGIGITNQKTKTLGISNSSRASQQGYFAESSYKNRLIVGRGASTSFPLTFGTPTYIPRINRSYRIAGVTTGYEMDHSGSYPFGEIGSIGVTTGELFEIYRSEGTVVSRGDANAYGYLHMEKGQHNSGALLDYNRENEGEVVGSMKVLPVTSLTYDIFRESGVTGGSNFRAFRNDVGTVYTPKNLVTDNNTIEQVALNMSALLIGSSHTKTLATTSGTGTSEKYSSVVNYAGNNLKYKDIEANSPETETYYFKGIGEPTPADTSLFNQYGGANASRILIGQGSDLSNGPVKTYSRLENYSNGTSVSSTPVPIPTNNFNSSKQVRNTIYNQLNAFEAKNAGIPNIISVEANTDANVASTLTETTLNRITTYRKSHHLSAIDVVQPSGARYNYDIPVYTLKEKQVVFNASLNTITDSTNLVQYSNSDISTTNNNGRDHLFTSTTVPAYAHTFLLTSILSPDYSDRTGNGLSEDDYGNYIQLNYTNVYPDSNPFKWKTPYNTGSASEASYLENNKTYTDDDLGTYTYGEKEMWYVNSIEGKNYIAKFFLSDRKDLYSVSDEGGALNTSKAAKKLDKIELYSKQELITNSTNPTPIQTVYFEYDYSLCTGFSGNAGLGTGNAGGKLTLVKVYTTYGDSQKGARSPYEFSYNGSNKSYNGNNVDRWGVYKQNGSDGYNNVNFPYAYQGTSRDSASFSWSLTDIILPSNGKIHVDYESDQYASVQGKTPMVMVNILGFGYENEISSSSPSIKNNFRNRTNPETPRNVAYIDLNVDQTSYSAALADLEKSIGDISQSLKIYYQCEVETQKGSGNYELVAGFAYITGYGVNPSTLAPYIILEGESVREESFNSSSLISMIQSFNNIHGYKVNPIQKDAWQHFRQNVSRIIFPDGINASALQVDVYSLLLGLSKALNNYKFAWQINPNKSFIRLYEPSGYKYGGGNRVKKITYNDNWFTMTGEDNYEYGLSFEYNTPVDVHNLIKSSGVVQYEPFKGNAINPYKMPVEYIVKNVAYPWDYYEHLEPFGESFFDAPYVGYSNVKINNLKAGVINKNIGYTVYEYNTSDNQNYRTRVDRTPISNPVKVTPVVNLNLQSKNLTATEQYNIFGLSQGFVVEKTDMHGKLKKVVNYDANDQVVSINEYFYKGVNEKSKVVNSDGSIENKLMGRDYDFVHDLIYSEKISGTTVNTDINQLWLPFHKNYSATGIYKEAYLLSSFTKVIQNYTMLDHVESTYLGARTISKNLAFDGVTGDPIATTSDNEYNDEIKSMSYPAYWYYDGMKPAYHSINNHLLGVNIVNNGTSDGIIQASAPYNVGDYFRQGDELFVEGLGSGAASFKAWVLNVDIVNNELFLIDKDGIPITPQNNVNVRVIRSGYRNQQSASMLSFTDLDPQMDSVQASKPVSSGAMTYKERWSTLCGECNPSVDSVVNPFESGMLDVWRPYRSYAYQVDRKEQTTSSAVDLRTGGEYDNYSPFYTISSNKWVSKFDGSYPGYYSTNSANWLLSQEITAYNQNGAVAEAKDVLGRYSGVIFGYDGTQKKVPVAMANNAKNTELAFDGFEDYAVFSSGSCTQQRHIDFSEYTPYFSTNYISSVKAHTGRFSLKLENGQSVTASSTTNPLIKECYSNLITAGGFQVQLCNCRKSFTPEPGKYLLSAWAKEDSVSSSTRYTVPEIIVTVYGTSTSHDTIVSDNDVIIDGWQQLEGTFTIPSGADSIRVTLNHNGGGTYKVYFDDLRIHPFNSSMVANVYDPVSMRKWAVLDSYNYATFYEYNDQGILTRIKQETTEGIRTITEIRRSTIKH